MHMEYVLRKKFYHINRADSAHQMKVGNHYAFGTTPNLYINRLKKSSISYSKKETGISYSMKDYIPQLMKGGIKDPKKCIDLMKFANDSLIVQNLLTREIAFEEVRSLQFPNSPSRMKGIWLINTDTKNVKYWKKILGKGKILEVEVSGRIHQGSNNHLLDDSCISYNEYLHNAFLYWSGADSDKIPEIIAEGEVIVIKEVNIDNL